MISNQLKQQPLLVDLITRSQYCMPPLLKQKLPLLSTLLLKNI
jgi:hypothetical protein